jgi:transcriptional regulator with GAF, ATPase, and Fis domain
VLERATILTSAEALTPEVLDLPRGAKAPPTAGPPPVPRRDATGADAAAPDLRTLEDVERDHIRSVLRHTDGRLYGAKGAAKLLGMKPTTLQSRMKKLGVERVEELRRD